MKILVISTLNYIYKYLQQVPAAAVSPNGLSKLYIIIRLKQGRNLPEKSTEIAPSE